jgi:hypothetical protein
LATTSGTASSPDALLPDAQRTNETHTLTVINSTTNIVVALKDALLP